MADHHARSELHCQRRRGLRSPIGISIGAAIGSVGLAALVAGCSDAAPADSLTATLRTTNLSLPSLSVPARTASMGGPESGRLLDLGDQDIYVQQFRAYARNLSTGEVEQQFICHAHLGPTDPKAATEEPALRLEVAKSFMGVQGAPEIILPEGFAVKFQAGQALGVTGMALNSDPHGTDQDIRYDIEIDYWEGADARALGIEALDVLWVPLLPAQGRPMHHRSMHWTVPPGRHTYSSTPRSRLIVGERSRVHYIAAHLHAFGQWVELYDLTAKRAVWRGEAETDADRRYLTHIQHYSSEEGLVLHRAHRYELRAAYSNPLDESIDAMATLRLFYRPDLEADDS